MEIRQKKQDHPEQLVPESVSSTHTEISFFVEETLFGTLLFGKLPLNLKQMLKLLTPEDFTRKDHQVLYHSIQQCYEQTNTITPLHVIKLLRTEITQGNIDVSLFSTLANVIFLDVGLQELFIEIKSQVLCKTLQRHVLSQCSKTASILVPVDWINSIVFSLEEARSEFEQLTSYFDE